MKQDRFVRLENIIAGNQEYFFKIGKALKEIRDSRLYKQALFKSFEVYVKGRWDMGRAQAYRLINSYEVIRNLSPIGDILPANESQARLLSPLKPFDQRKVWKDFLESGVEMTTRNIKKFIKTPVTNKNFKPEGSDRISPEYLTAVMAMLEQIRVAQHDHWQQTSRQAALLWSRVICEKILSRRADDG